MNALTKPLATLAMAFTLAPAWAAGQHGGDIQPWFANGQVQVNGNLFESNFGDLSGGPFRTDDPGFDADTDQGAFSAGNWLWYGGVGSLKFWNGSAWSASVPGGEYVTISEALGGTTTFTTAGISNPNGVVGQFDGAGDLHEHLDFSVYTGSNVLGGTAGAYWITLQLFQTAAGGGPTLGTPSVPFSIVFNRGLSTENFEAAVAAVPVPAAVWLFGSALAGLGVFKRRGTTVPA
jgi:hypothetical protein